MTILAGIEKGVRVAAGIAGVGVYVPPGRLRRQVIADEWGTPAAPGDRSVAGVDEDSLTMAVQAGQHALDTSGTPPEKVDALYFATTTSPYQEKQGATIAAAALGLGDAAVTADVMGSLRCGLSALRAAMDAVDAGRAESALVLVADCRVPESGSMAEQLASDAAAAFLVSANSQLATVDGWGAVHDDLTARWRETGDRIVRSFEERLELGPGFTRVLPEACRRALRQAGLDVAAVSRAALAGPNPRAPISAARAAGIARDAVVAPPLNEVGDAGAAGAPLALVAALEASVAGDRLLAGGYGDGAEAVVLTRGEVPVTALTDTLARRVELPSYGAYLAARRLLPAHEESDELEVSPVAYWRRRRAVLGRYGGVCRSCETVQFPPATTCVSCGALDTLDPVRLAGSGTLYTFTNDHLSGGQYVDRPVPRCVIDLDGGGRFYTTMTDTDPQRVRIGMRVELTFRSRGSAGGFRNYGWKCRPMEV